MDETHVHESVFFLKGKWEISPLNIFLPQLVGSNVIFFKSKVVYDSIDLRPL